MQKIRELELKPCIECGGDRVLVSTVVRGISGLADDVVIRQPRRSIIPFGKNKRSNTSSSQALTCIRCGYITLYALQPDNLIPDQSQIKTK